MTPDGADLRYPHGVSRLTSGSVTAMPNDEREPLMTTEDVAALLKVSTQSVQTMARRGELPGFKIGTAWRFRATSIARWRRDVEASAEVAQ